MVRALVAVAVIVPEPPKDTATPLKVTLELSKPALGSPVALVKVNDEGVPRLGVTNVGLEARTKVPVPVPVYSALVKWKNSFAVPPCSPPKSLCRVTVEPVNT